jgi:hypothetical protein
MEDIVNEYDPQKNMFSKKTSPHYEDPLLE